MVFACELHWQGNKPNSCVWMWHKKKSRFEIKSRSFITFVHISPQTHITLWLPHFTPQMGSRNAQSALALGYLWLPSGFIALTLEPDSSCVEAGCHNRDAFCFWSTVLNIAPRAPSHFIQTERIKMPNHGKPSLAPYSLSAEGRWENNLLVSLVDLWLA